MKLVFTDEALDDLEHIHDFLLEVEVPRAHEIKDGIISSASRLMDFPKLGRLVHSSVQWGEVRDVFTRHYCLRYAVFDGNIHVLRVWHQRENERNE